MRRCGLVIVLCGSVAVAQSGVPAFAQPASARPGDRDAVERRVPDDDAREPENRCKSDKNAPDAEAAVARPESPAASVRDATFCAGRRSAAAGAGSAGGVAVSIHGWLQANFLFFPEARTQEVSDVLSPSSFSRDSATASRRQFWTSARDSRVNLDARTSLPTGRWRAVAEFDFFGKAPRSYDPRVQQAYVEWTTDDERWRVKSGQDWSAFADPDSYAAIYNPLPLGAVFVRQPQLRVAYETADGMRFAVSLERARGDVASAGGAVPIAAFEERPDLVLSVRRERPRGAMQWSGLLRDGRNGRAAGWGVSASGALHLSADARPKDLRFQLVYGSGIARYVGEFGPRFEREAADRARAAGLPPYAGRVFAANASYAHRLARRLSGTIQASMAHADPRGARSMQRETVAGLAANTAFRPDDATEFALEFLTLRRRDGTAAAERRSVWRLTARWRF